MAEDTDGNALTRMRRRLGRRFDGLVVLVLIGLASVVIRLLIAYDFDHSALLYVAVPYAISLALTLAWEPGDTHWWSAYARHTRMALIVFLASSVVLFEGFICVLFFIPIYLLGISIAFLITWLSRSLRSRRGRALVSALPVLVFATSLEGTSEPLSFSRDDTVTVTRVVAMGRAEVLDNLARPIALGAPDSALMSVFPMPYRIDAGSLAEGDVHTVHTRYHRWFFTNTHEGEMRLRIREVGPDRVVTDFIEDSTYFASYLTLRQSRIALEALGDGRTRITLSIDYTRRLDPAWYFGPLQRHALAEMSDFLIREVMVREHVD